LYYAKTSNKQISEKSFVYNLNSSLFLTTGDADSYTIRVPFASKSFINLNYITNTRTNGLPLVATVCKILREPLRIEDASSDIQGSD
jgi:hypothetical protein